MKLFLTYNQSAKSYEKFKGYEFNRFKDACDHAGVECHQFDPGCFPTVDEDSSDICAVNMSGSMNESHYRFLRTLEIKGAKLLNPANGSKTAEEKMLSNLEMAHYGLPVPKTMDLNLSHTNFNMEYLVKNILNNVGMPCVIKSPNGNNGNAVVKVENENNLVDLLGLLGWTSVRYGDFFSTSNLMAQEFISSTQGKVIRLVFLDNEVLGCELKTNPNFWKPQSPFVYNSENNIIVDQGKYIPESGYKREKTKASAEMIELAKKVSDLFKLNFFGLDLLFGPSGYIICEVNTSPQLEGFEKSTGINVAEKILQFLQSK
jgi:glutathione synthase/RimK-type ligase-like ATP-grasp enzyme